MFCQSTLIQEFVELAHSALLATSFSLSPLRSCLSARSFVRSFVLAHSFTSHTYCHNFVFSKCQHNTNVDLFVFRWQSISELSRACAKYFFFRSLIFNSNHRLIASFISILLRSNMKKKSFRFPPWTIQDESCRRNSIKTFRSTICRPKAEDQRATQK